VLIGGDAPMGSWEILQARDPELIPAAAIRVPHHGGDATEWAKEWTSYGDLYDRVNAELAVISVGTNNPSSYGHPHEDHVEAISRGGKCRVLCTQLTPRCHEAPLELRNAMMEQATMVEPPYRHWDEDGRLVHDEVPCAGTVVVWIDAAGTLHHEPSPDSEHSKLLLRIDDPMCTRAL